VANLQKSRSRCRCPGALNEAYFLGPHCTNLQSDAGRCSALLWPFRAYEAEDVNVEQCLRTSGRLLGQCGSGALLEKAGIV
jgi:hypothetical protein